MLMRRSEKMRPTRLEASEDPRRDWSVAEKAGSLCDFRSAYSVRALIDTFSWLSQIQFQLLP